MEQKIINAINSFKPKSVEATLDQQICLVPRNEDQQIYAQTFEYMFENQRTLVAQRNECGYRLHYLRLMPMAPRDYIAQDQTITRMDRLVKNNIIHPFMFFLNGRFVKWTMIYIVCSKENYWLLVNAGDDQFWRNIVRGKQEAHLVTLPDGVVYEEVTPIVPAISPLKIQAQKANNKISTAKSGIARADGEQLFGFKYTGEYDPVNPDVVITNVSHKLKSKAFSTTEAVNASILTNDQSIKLYPQNVTLFRNGLYDPTATINVDGTFITIDSGKNENADKLEYVFSYNTIHVDNPDVVAKTYPAYVQPLLQAKYKGEEYPPYVDQLLEQFKMKMTHKKLYNQNLLDCIQTMMSYDTTFFKNAWLEDSNLVIEEYTGAEVLAKVNEDGVWNVSRMHSAMIDEYILMLVNGEMYEYYYMSKYIASTYAVPIQGINPEDRVELLRFQNVCNARLDITLHENDIFQPLDPQLINENMILFSTETNQNYFTYPEDGDQHFPVEYSIETNEDGWLKVIPKDPFYYNKPLKIAYKSQFRHKWYKLEVAEGVDDKYIIDLGTTFMYCNDYAKFVVFYNGRRLASDQFRLTLPVRATTPFSKFELYLTKAVKTGDRIDVIYTPSYWKDVILVPEVPVTGDVVVDKSLLNYPLDKDLYLCWINGKKVPKSSLSNIDSTHIRITTDEKSTKNVCLTAYLAEIPELTEAFHQYEALWDKITAQLSDEELYGLLNIIGDELTNTDPTMYEGAIHVRSVMWELIREQYIMNPRVDITGPFIYDYLDVDTTAVNGYDSAGNAVLDAMDANRTDNIDNVERPWP